ncbi:methyltransferase domain-containing protein [Candidatus Woesearchaeota archaeon]|nr:methyltransferase domain-containing protein [Candidatus Woesearchaeota archaeon]
MEEALKPGKRKGMEKLQNEHMARYIFACQFVNKKDVLDLGCGYGYGADMMASTARRVLGVDRSRKVIEYSGKKYKKNNLAFRKDDCRKLGIDGKYDIITSFEVIEHIDRPEDFLREIRRLLKKDGLLIISTPNVQRPLADYEEKNPYHIKEYTQKDFKKLLDDHFRRVSVFSQTNHLASVIADKKAGSKLISDFHQKSNMSNMSNIVPEYLVAVCSSKPIKAESLMFIDNNDYITNLAKNWWEKDVLVNEQAARIREHEQHIRYKNSHINKIEKQNQDLKNYAIEKEKQLKRIFRSRGWKLLTRIHRIKKKLGLVK